MHLGVIINDAQRTRDINLQHNEKLSIKVHDHHGYW